MADGTGPELQVEFSNMHQLAEVLNTFFYTRPKLVPIYNMRIRHDAKTTIGRA
jgi:hypothetical protein